jgi:K+-sensing histidine kinase KdpD
MNASPEHLDQIVEECLREAGQAGKEGGPLPVIRQLAPGLPAYPLDRALIKEAVSCLLSEAIAHLGPKARLRVTVKANRNALMLAVKAPGVGLTTDERESLFAGEPSFGTLARARSIITTHHGVVWANGLPGKGITYYVSLPIRGASGL